MFVLIFKWYCVLTHVHFVDHVQFYKLVSIIVCISCVFALAHFCLSVLPLSVLSLCLLVCLSLSSSVCTCVSVFVSLTLGMCFEVDGCE